MKIKLPATSDLHGKLEQFQAAVLKERPDVVVIAGDVTNRSKDLDFHAAAVDVWASLWSVNRNASALNNSIA